MQKIIVLSVFALVGSGLATAGQIQIGSGTNGVNGLTASYIGSGITGTFNEQNYDGRLFQTAQLSGTLVTPPYTTGTYTQASSPSPSTIVDTGAGALTDSSTGVTFNMITDGTGLGGSNNFWQGATAGATITIPVGVFDVTDVWTLINNVWGTPNVNGTTVKFNFGTSATTTSETLTVALTNSGSTTGGGATPSGEVATSVQCTTTVAAQCNTFAIGPTAASTLISTSGTASGSLPTISVLTDTLSAGMYNSAAGNFAGSAGQVIMTDQGFQFGSTFYGLYLVSVQVTEVVGGAHTSESGLSAITVDATPEPSTIWLLIAGIGVAGIARFQLRKN